jgi:hypothetical protein
MNNPEHKAKQQQQRRSSHSKKRGATGSTSRACQLQRSSGSPAPAAAAALSARAAPAPKPSAELSKFLPAEHTVARQKIILGATSAVSQSSSTVTPSLQDSLTKILSSTPPAAVQPAPVQIAGNCLAPQAVSQAVGDKQIHFSIIVPAVWNKQIHFSIIVPRKKLRAVSKQICTPPWWTAVLSVMH